MFFLLPVYIINCCHMSRLRGLIPPVLLLRTAFLSSSASTCSRAPLLLPRVSTKCLSTMAYSIIERGSKNGDDYRVYFQGPSGIVSPWHDIPLMASKEENIYNMVVEIPRWTNAKMEMGTACKMNFIKQDQKKGKLRYVANVFPHHGYIWNYGAFPQTWESPAHVDKHTGAKGDNDPLDVCEIGDKVHKRGAIVQVKVLGIMAMIDEGETDWKVLVIDVTDPLAAQMNDVDDIERFKPGFLKATYEWFVLYKIPDGKPKNTFAFNGEAKNRDFALEIISQTSEQWKQLVMKQTDAGGLAGENVSVEGSPLKISQDEAQAAVSSSAEPSEDKLLPDGLDKWHYVS